MDSTVVDIIGIQENHPAEQIDSKPSGLGSYVARRAQELQSRYFASDSRARAQLATLRRNVGKPVGADPDIWQIVFNGFPQNLVGHFDEPNHWELAAHTALTLFGIHMQSAKKPLHISGIGLGKAIRLLVTASGRADQDSPVLRRFHALGTATVFSEVVHHARGLIQLLRSENIGLDYGKFADNLADFQFPAKQNKIRLQWARELYRYENSNKETKSISL